MNKRIQIPKIFFGFLLTSFFMWLLINLSKEYVTKITYYVSYDNLAQDKILQETPLQKIDFLIKGNGFKLFTASFSNKRLSFSVDKLKSKNITDYYLLTSNKKREIQDQLNSGLELVDILKDTLHFKLGTLKTKKVPVVPDLDLNYKLGFGLAEMKINPDSVLISGPELQINKIKEITTKKATFQEVNEDFSTDLEVERKILSDNVKLSNSSISIELLIDKFTEGTLEVPIKIINAPKNLELNTFPKNVKITYRVGLKNYNKISADLFNVVCDYKFTKDGNLSYLVPKLEDAPELISLVRVSPQKVDFLIQK